MMGMGDPAAVTAELERELAKVQKADQLLRRARLMGAQPKTEKQARDAALWSEWLQGYQARLLDDSPEAARICLASAEAELERQRQMRAVNPRVVRTPTAL